MFKWLKRRMVREHAKLLVQNRQACEILADGWYAEKDDLRDHLLRKLVIVDGLVAQFDLTVGLEQDVVGYLLDLNKELRRIHEAGPALIGEGFDQAYRPLGGYDDAINRWFADDY